jgi:hypothetical protein
VVNRQKVNEWLSKRTTLKEENHSELDINVTIRDQGGNLNTGHAKLGEVI